MRIHPAFKIVCVSIVCIQVCYLHYILFNSHTPGLHIKSTDSFIVGIVLYLFVFFFFAQHYWRQKRRFMLFVWIVLTCAMSSNAIIWSKGEVPSIPVQYSQSTSLLVYAALLLFSKSRGLNWERIFAVTCLLTLIPCLFFFFAQDWPKYEALIYLLTFTPILNSLVFLEPVNEFKDEIVDDLI